MSVRSAAAAQQTDRQTDRQTAEQSRAAPPAARDDPAASAQPRPPDLGAVHTVVTVVNRRVTETRETSFFFFLLLEAITEEATPREDLCGAFEGSFSKEPLTCRRQCAARQRSRGKSRRDFFFFCNIGYRCYSL